MTLAEIQRRLGIGVAAAMRVQQALGDARPVNAVDPHAQLPGTPSPREKESLDV